MTRQPCGYLFGMLGPLDEKTVVAKMGGLLPRLQMGPRGERGWDVGAEPAASTGLDSGLCLQLLDEREGRVWAVRTNDRSAALDWMERTFKGSLLAPLDGEPGQLAPRFFTFHEIALGLCPMAYAELFVY